jgi:hypothetical protein
MGGFFLTALCHYATITGNLVTTTVRKPFDYNLGKR